MSTNKSERELAFLRDLYVATDWSERFAEMVNEHVKLPSKGQVLYVASGTGGHPIALGERAGSAVTVVGIDESEECLDLARAKAVAMNSPAEFRRAQLEALSFEDEQFALVVGDASLVAPERLPEMLAEMTRVTAPGGTVALSVATSSSFGEFFSIYWEALARAGFEEHGADVEGLITGLPTVSEVEAMAEREGLEATESWTRIEEFDFESGEQFLNSPLITDFLMTRWLDSLPDAASRERVSREVATIIDEERKGGDFALSAKATLVVGRKAS